MKTSEYWQKRFSELEELRHGEAAAGYQEISRQYQEAERELERQISVWYQRFAASNGISMQEARKLLSKAQREELQWDIEEYIKKGEENAITPIWKKQLENASAKAHISRLDALKLQIQQQTEKLFGNQLDSVDKTMRRVYEGDYYHTAFELQKGFSIGRSFSQLDERSIQKVLERPWAPDGRNFSDRIWSNKQLLVNELNTTMTQNIILGKDPQKAIQAISRRLKVSQTAAGRLVMTESAAIGNAAQRDSFRELGVEQYEIVATLDSRTSEICRHMDGKHFKMSEWQTGVTAPPFHVNCRTATAPYFEEDLDQIGVRAARDEESGKTYYVPANMSYEEWKKAFVDGDKTGFQLPREDDKIKAKSSDPMMRGLADVSMIQSNDDLKVFAEKVIDNMGIDRTGIQVNITGMQDFGHCTISQQATKDIVKYDKYELNANDQRSMTHRVKTAFHEAFHLSADGRSWDAVDSSWRIKESWRALEETHTECAAHYLLERYGVKDKLCPSYARELVMNLPRLKQLEKYSSCATIQDFGKIAFADRQSGQGAMWMQLSKKMKRVKIPEDYYPQYYGYINDHEDELFDMWFGNMPGFESYREQMKGDLASAMTKTDRLFMLQNNESLVFFNIMACAMQKVGIL